MRMMPFQVAEEDIEYLHLSPVPPAGEGWESRGTSPSGAVRVGPLAAQAKRTGVLNFSS